MEAIQTKLSQKQETFSEFLFAISKSTLNLNIFRKKMSLIANIFPKLQTPQNVVRYMSKKSRFKGNFDKQHGKRTKTQLRSEGQYRYPI